MTRESDSESWTRVQFDDGMTDYYPEEDLIVEGAEMPNTVKQYSIGDIVDIKDALVRFKDVPANKQGIREGDLAVYLGNSGLFRRGEVVRLRSDDGTTTPSWQGKDDYNYLAIDDFASLPQYKSKSIKPAVVSTMTVYSDNVKVSDTELQFDGRTWNREELKTLVKRYQEVLRRPVATVQQAAKKKPAAKKKVATKKSKA